MNRKNTVLILCIVLFMGMIFSVSCFEWNNAYNYDEQCQIYSISTNTVKSVNVSKSVKRVGVLFILCLFMAIGILYSISKKWLRIYFKRIEIHCFLKQVRVAQQMDGKKRTIISFEAY